MSRPDPADIDLTTNADWDRAMVALRAELAENNRVTEMRRVEGKRILDELTRERAAREAAERERHLAQRGRDWQYELAVRWRNRCVAVEEREKQLREALSWIDFQAMTAIREGYLHMDAWKDVQREARAALGSTTAADTDITSHPYLPGHASYDATATEPAAADTTEDTDASPEQATCQTCGQPWPR